MKILEMSTEAPPYNGGISRLVGLLSRGLNDRGHEVDILTPRVRFKEFKISTRQFSAYKHYDIIHLHGPTPFWSDFALMRNNSVPVVYTHHANISWVSEGLSNYYRLLHRKLANTAKVIIVHSNDYAELIGGNNIQVLRMPIMFNVPHDCDEQKKADIFTVLYVGQLRPFKGIDTLIFAARNLKNVNFTIAGQGYIRKKLEKVAEGSKNIKFMGAVTDLQLKELYTNSHIICLPSINTTEAYGLSLLEGSLYGCVPIASDLPGVRENINHLGGLLFRPLSVGSFSRQISLLTENYDEWLKSSQRVKNSAMAYVQKYNPSYYAKCHEAIFEQCLHK